MDKNRENTCQMEDYMENIHNLKVLIKTICFVLVNLCISIGAYSQKYYYEGGYFEKKDNKWYEYKDNNPTEAVNWFTEVYVDDNFYVGDNGNCKIAIPKSPQNNFLLMYKNSDKWVFKYKSKNSISVISKNKQEIQKIKEKMKKCSYCHGTGYLSSKCVLCNGTGQVLMYNIWSPCSACSGKGAHIFPCGYCSACNMRIADLEATDGMTVEQERNYYISKNKGTININSNISIDNTHEYHSKICAGCNGTGRCTMCNGRGTYWLDDVGMYTGEDKKVLKTCSACNGTGQCQVCYGKGAFK